MKGREPATERGDSPDPVDLLLETLRLGQAPDVAGLASRWSRLELTGFAQLLQYEDCEVWLHRRLSDLGILQHVHAELVGFLTRRTRQVTAHKILVGLERDALVATLNRSATPHVLLKGSAYRLLRDRYPYVDTRMTADVDVLLPQDAAGGIWHRLRERGFEVALDARDSYEDHHHLEPLAGERLITVELHTSTARRLPASEAWRRVYGSSREIRIRRTEGAGGAGGAEGAEESTTRVPCATELFWHAVSHAHSNPLQAFKLRLLQDAATIWAAGEEIDWDVVIARLDGDELPHPAIARRWLHAAGWLVGQSRIDERLAAGTRPFDLHRALRWRLAALRRLRSARHMWVPDAVDHRPVSRARRFLIDVGTASELGVRPTHRTFDRSRLGRIAMGVGGAVVRRVYQAWNRARGQGSGVRGQGPGAGSNG